MKRSVVIMYLSSASRIFVADDTVSGALVTSHQAFRPDTNHIYLLVFRFLDDYTLDFIGKGEGGLY